MTPQLPPELLELIVDHLHDEPTTLRSCCLVSKSWVQRTRKHLFAGVEFDPEKSPLESWVKTFPDPSNSPAHYTRSLSISGLPTPAASGSSTRICICAFRNLERLTISAIRLGYGVRGTFVPLHGISPTLQSLTVSDVIVPLSDVFDLICSFLSLDNLELTRITDCGDPNETWIIPPTSPKLSGALRLRTLNETRSIIRHLLDLPGGLLFSKILAGYFFQAEITVDLVPRCFNTLETLQIGFTDFDRWNMPPPLDLSKATKLKDLNFTWCSSNTKWIAMTLQTAKSKNLRKIVIRISSDHLRFPRTRVRSEWQDLEQLLVELWTSRSIFLEVKYSKGEEGTWRRLVVDLLPKLTSMGVVEAALD